MPAPKAPASETRDEHDPDFVYVIYIRAPIQTVWNALTDGSSLRPWWANTLHASTFKVGDPIVYRRNGAVDVRGVILENTEPARLAYTFHIEGPGPQHDEGPSHVVYDLAQTGDMTMLKITHSGFRPNSKVRASISNGWPAILSSLKSELETGRPLIHPDWEHKQ